MPRADPLRWQRLRRLAFFRSVRLTLCSLRETIPVPLRSAETDSLRSLRPGVFRSNCSRSLLVNLPPSRPAFSSGCAGLLRSSAGPASRPLRRSSSPADFPPVRSAPQTLRVTGESGTLARPGTATFLRLPLRGFSLRRLRQNPLVPAPSLRRPQPTFAFFCSGSFVRPVPLRLGADPSQAQDHPPGSAQPGRPSVASATSSRAPSPSLPSLSCRKLLHSAARPLSRQTRFAGLCREPFIPLRSLPGNLPVLRTASAGSGRAPLRQIPFQSAPLQRLLAAPAPASGCSVPLRGTASAGSGRTPFVLTPPLRPAQAQAR